jgi:hypothetical protein
MARKTSQSITAAIDRALQDVAHQGTTYLELQATCDLSQMTVRRFCRIGLADGRYVMQLEKHDAGVIGTRRLRIWAAEFAPEQAKRAAALKNPSREVAYRPRLTSAFDPGYVSVMDSVCRGM